MIKLMIALLTLSSASAIAQTNHIKVQCKQKGLKTILRAYNLDEFIISDASKVLGSKDYEFTVTELKGDECTYLYRCRVENNKVKSVVYTGHSDCNMEDHDQ